MIKAMRQKKKKVKLTENKMRNEVRRKKQKKEKREKENRAWKDIITSERNQRKSEKGTIWECNPE